MKGASSMVVMRPIGRGVVWCSEEAYEINRTLRDRLERMCDISYILKIAVYREFSNAKAE